jgi:hypothetical protein
MKVYDLEEYRQRKQLRDKLSELEQMEDQVYLNYEVEEQVGYERFKRLIEILVLSDEEDNFDEEENND